MISGSLLDATLRWFIASGEKASNGEKIDNKYITNANYAKYLGNYYYSEFRYIEDKDPRGPVYDQEKKANTAKLVATGSTEHTKINNIYDIGGNRYEWTTETNKSWYGVLRGGYYYSSNWGTLSYRDDNNRLDSVNKSVHSILYVK